MPERSILIGERNLASFSARRLSHLITKRIHYVALYGFYLALQR